MRGELSPENSEFIKEGKQNFENHLNRLRATQGTDDYPILNLTIGKNYSMEELSRELDWPVAEGLAIFLHDLRVAKGTSSKNGEFLQPYLIGLEFTPPDGYVFKKIKDMPKKIKKEKRSEEELAA